MIYCSVVNDSPALSMLWESEDPAEQLTRRFGFRDVSAAAEWVGEVLERHWDLEVTGCDRLVISAWNAMAWITVGDRRLIAKWSAMPNLFGRLHDIARVVNWLDARDIPVAAQIPAADGRLLVGVGNGAKGRLRSRLPTPGSRFLVGVLPVVDGDLLDVEDSAQVEDAGVMLARVHEALASYPDLVGGHRPHTQEQLVHNDFRSANILYDQTRITAVLDHEELTYDRRVADLAKAAVMLGTRYRNWAPSEAGVREAFIAAYSRQAQVPFTSLERDLLADHTTQNMNKPYWSWHSQHPT